MFFEKRKAIESEGKFKLNWVLLAPVEGRIKERDQGKGGLSAVQC